MRQVEALRRTVSEYEIAWRMDNATKAVERVAAGIVPNMDAEWPDAALKLVVPDLTLKIIREPGTITYGK